ncbi:RNA polymerase sigma factor [Salinisphaera sp. PC39]|uniref:sigma-70 family RNA polymerase sigma factor n=1 Tax=Salinisphaera sp. PC39 TaxID=1304156 RepID=UPI00333F83A3
METASLSRPALIAAAAANATSARRSATGGDRERFDTLVAPLVGDLYRFAHWLCDNPATAEDVAQETCLRAWRSLDSLKDPKAVKSWLFTTLRREHARLHERKRLEIADDVEPAAVAGEDNSGPDHDLDRQRLRQAIRRLPPGYRKPLAMQVLLGCNVREIAQNLEIGESAVMTRLFRARKKLMADFKTGAPAPTGQSDTHKDA